MILTFVLIYVILWIIPCMIIAKTKNLNLLDAFFISLFFGFFALIYYIFVKSKANFDEVYFICSDCGEKVDINSQFCSNCGAKFEKNKCPKCNSKINFNDLFCSNCGFKLKNKYSNLKIDFDSDDKLKNKEYYCLK